VRGNAHTLHGRTQSLKDWAREFNMPYATLRDRMATGRYSLEEALTAPRQGDLAPGAYGTMSVWRRWITAPLVSPSTDSQ
jgi:hypothetical protein